MSDINFPGGRDSGKIVYEEQSWMASAACRGADTTQFFYDTGRGAAKHNKLVREQFCDNCIVRRACGEYAINHQIIDGIWGGMGTRQLRYAGQAYRKSLSEHIPPIVATA